MDEETNASRPDRPEYIARMARLGKRDREQARRDKRAEKLARRQHRKEHEASTDAEGNRE